MTPREIVLRYLASLERGDAAHTTALFAPDAVVHSPLEGTVPAPGFFHGLFSRTRSSRITLLNVLAGDDARTVAAHFRYDWTLADGTPAPFECVDVFTLDDAGRITELRIIYDTHPLRGDYERVGRDRDAT